MTARVDPLGKILRAVFPTGEREALYACHAYRGEPHLDEALRHAGLVDIAHRVLLEGQSLEEAGRAVSGYASRVQAVAFACAQLHAAGRLMVWAGGARAQEKSAMANAARRIARLERDVARRDAALKGRVAIPA